MSAHEETSLIKTPKQLIAVVIAAFAVPIITIMLLVTFVGSQRRTGAGTDSTTPEATAARIAPVAHVELASNASGASAAGGAASAPATGSGAGTNTGTAPAPAATDNQAAMSAPGSTATPSAPPAGGAPAGGAPGSGAAGPATADAGSDAGQKLFQSVCIACHGTGAAGAPKFGDKAAWAPRIAQGLNTLYDHALKGFQGKNGVMPPKGGSAASDDDVKAAVRYMANAAK